jgi:hypothetical protein
MKRTESRQGFPKRLQFDSWRVDGEVEKFKNQFDFHERRQHFVLEVHMGPGIWFTSFPSRSIPVGVVRGKMHVTVIDFASAVEKMSEGVCRITVRWV